MTAVTDRPPVAVIAKRENEQVRVDWGEYQGAKFLDLRVYYRDAGGSWRPTRKGVTFRPDQLEELAEAIAAATRTGPRL